MSHSKWGKGTRGSGRTDFAQLLCGQLEKVGHVVGWKRLMIDAGTFARGSTTRSWVIGR